MTCWIEDELHLEEHGGPAMLAHQLKSVPADWNPRPCNALCRDGVHATIAFASDGPSNPVGHCFAQFIEAHGRWADVVSVEPAHEVTPEMYPNRVHRGAPADPPEKLVACLVHFKGKEERYGPRERHA